MFTLGVSPDDHEIFGLACRDEFPGMGGDDDLEIRSFDGGPAQITDEAVLQLGVQMRLRLFDDHRRVEDVRKERVLIGVRGIGRILQATSCRISFVGQLVG
jgi:hypothetical protein